MCSIPTTVLWPSRILELMVLLWSVQLLTQAVVHLQILQLSGTFPMELRSKALAWHSPELGLFLLEQYVSTVTLGLPQQESSAVTYLMAVETYRASMSGYILPLQVSAVYWRETLLYDLSYLGSMRPVGRGMPITEKHVCCVYSYQHVIKISHSKATQISFPVCGLTSD